MIFKNDSFLVLIKLPGLYIKAPGLNTAPSTDYTTWSTGPSRIIQYRSKLRSLYEFLINLDKWYREFTEEGPLV